VVAGQADLADVERPDRVPVDDLQHVGGVPSYVGERRCLEVTAVGGLVPVLVTGLAQDARVLRRSAVLGLDPVGRKPPSCPRDVVVGPRERVAALVGYRDEIAE